MKATKITRVIGVGDMRRAVLFYQEALGLAVQQTSPYWSDLTCGDGNLALLKPPTGPLGGSPYDGDFHGCRSRFGDCPRGSRRWHAAKSA